MLVVIGIWSITIGGTFAASALLELATRTQARIDGAYTRDEIDASWKGIGVTS